MTSTNIFIVSSFSHGNNCIIFPISRSVYDQVHRRLQAFGDQVSIAMARFSTSLLFLMFFFVTNTFANEIYTNVWAVKIRGGQREVEKVALKHGFYYDKHVSTAQLLRPMSTKESFICLFFLYIS